MRIFCLSAALCYSLGCAVFQPIPNQSLNCATAEAPAVFTAAANAIAQHEDAAEIEAAAAGVSASTIACEALALESDINHAASVAQSASVSTDAVQLNARSYLTAKGVSVVTK